MISSTADAFDADWEWVMSPRKEMFEQRLQPGEFPQLDPADPELYDAEDVDGEAVPEGLTRSVSRDSAVVYLENMSGQNDVAELYQVVTRHPPQAVTQLLEGVCIALNVPPAPSASNRRGSYFAAGRKLLHDSSDLLFRLFTFDAEDLLADPRRRRALEKIVRALSVEKVAKVCYAAVGLTQWLHAVVANTDAAEAAAVIRRTKPQTLVAYSSEPPAAAGAAAARPRHAGPHHGLGPTPWLVSTSNPYCSWIFTDVSERWLLLTGRRGPRREMREESGRCSERARTSAAGLWSRKPPGTSSHRSAQTPSTPRMPPGRTRWRW